MNPLRYLLSPFAIIYYAITSIRNGLYDSGKWRSATFSIPVINVGNLNTGGSGKTPHIEYLIRLLRENYKIATLSRGYGRRTRGFLIADNQSDASQLGDEPTQIKKKFPDITVSVGENRLLAIPQLLNVQPDIEVVLLDDAYQHRSVRPGLNILLTTYQMPFYSDKILPIGNLRESRNGKKRADVIIVTKCPEKLTQEDKLDVINKIAPASHQKVFFSKIQYGSLYNPFDLSEHAFIPNAKYSLVTGIASEENLYTYLDRQNLEYDKISYRDHYRYSETDIKSIVQKVKAYNDSNPTIITTEKDFTRLSPFKDIFTQEQITILLLPIEMKIIDDEHRFNTCIIESVESIMKKH